MGNLAACYAAKANVVGSVDAAVGAGFNVVSHEMFLWAMSSFLTMGELGEPRLKEVFRCSEGFHDF
jgi:hypothetical protein